MPTYLIAKKRLSLAAAQYPRVEDDVNGQRPVIAVIGGFPHRTDEHRNPQTRRVSALCGDIHLPVRLNATEQICGLGTMPVG